MKTFSHTPNQPSRIGTAGNSPGQFLRANAHYDSSVALQNKTGYGTFKSAARVGTAINSYTSYNGLFDSSS